MVEKRDGVYRRLENRLWRGIEGLGNSVAVVVDVADLDIWVVG